MLECLAVVLLLWGVLLLGVLLLQGIRLRGILLLRGIHLWGILLFRGIRLRGFLEGGRGVNILLLHLAGQVDLVLLLFVGLLHLLR